MGHDTKRAVLSESALYYGDNGRIFCGACAGASARYTGRDISGQKVARVKPEDVAAWDADMARYYPTGTFPPLACESCGKQPSRIVAVQS